MVGARRTGLMLIEWQAEWQRPASRRYYHQRLSLRLEERPTLLPRYAQDALRGVIASAAAAICNAVNAALHRSAQRLCRRTTSPQRMRFAVVLSTTRRGAGAALR